MTNYIKQANDFLKKSNARMEMEFIGCVPNKEWEDKKERNLYKVTISTSKGSMNVHFWDSVYNTERDIKPSNYDILACLTKYDPGTFEDFCCEFGYDEDSRRAERIYFEVQKEYKNLTKIFTEEQMEELRDIY